METKLIKGLSQVQSKYDTFFIDLWGVVHNGIELYPGAIEVLENLEKIKNQKLFFRIIFAILCFVFFPVFTTFLASTRIISL